MQSFWTMINPYVGDPVADDDDDDDDAKLREDGFQEKLVDIMSIEHGPNLDVAAISNQAIISHFVNGHGIK